MVNIMANEYSRINSNHDKQKVSVRLLYFLSAQNIYPHNDCKWEIKEKNTVTSIFGKDDAESGTEEANHFYFS